MPQRLLRPQIRQSLRWNSLSLLAQSLYIRLLTMVDDYGRYESHPTLIRNEAFPYGDPKGNDIPVATIDGALLELASKTMLVLYENDGTRYLQLTRWRERVRSESKFPDPKACPVQTNASTMTAERGQMIASPPTPTPTPTPLRKRAVGSHEFEKFWEAYPKKKAKPAAEKAFNRQKCEQLLDVILAAIRRHRQLPEWIKDGGQFIPHPATWLNQRRWEDETQLMEPASTEPTIKLMNIIFTESSEPRRNQFESEDIYQACLENWERWKESL